MWNLFFSSFSLVSLSVCLSSSLSPSRCLFSLKKETVWTCGVTNPSHVSLSLSLALYFSVSPASVPTSIPRAVHSEDPITVQIAGPSQQAAQGLPLQPLKPFWTVFFPFFFFFPLSSKFCPGRTLQGFPGEKREGLARIGGSSPIGWCVCHHYVRRTTNRASADYGCNGKKLKSKTKAKQERN